MTEPTAAPDAEAAARRSRLLGLKLRALVHDHLAVDVGEASSFPPGAALVHDDAAWVLIDDQPAERLGAALAWALRSAATSVHVIADTGTGVLARRAGAFALPISVWHAADRTLLPAVAEPPIEPAAAPADHEPFRERIAAGGADPVVEHGVLVGEVRGLEVCRVVDDPHTGAVRLEVGVGAHDREAFQMLHGDVPTAESLARVVEAVAQHRVPGAPQHPLNRLAAERLLRWRVLDDPAMVGAVELAPMSPPVERRNLKDPAPCVAAGRDADGRPMVVVCSSGVDLDLVPFAADARLAAAAAHAVDPAEVGAVVVVPSRDRVRVTEELVAALRVPADIVTID